MEMMAESIKLQSETLYEHISTVENAIKDCANILTIKKVYLLFDSCWSLFKIPQK
jgi:hypothetical protein